MPRLPARSLIIATGCLVLAGCGSTPKSESMFMGESFDSDDIYSRRYAIDPAKACEAARRTLLGQGYLVTLVTGESVEASKNFQPAEEAHTKLDVRVSCVRQGSDQALVFVSAVQDRYSLKKSPTSASVGVGGLGSVSLPIGSSDDSLVRVASQTVSDAEFYTRFFERLRQYLPVREPVKPTPRPVPDAGESPVQPPATGALPADQA